MKKGLSPLVNPARGRRGYEINVAEEELARRLDGRSLFFSTDIKMYRFLKGDACLSPVRYQQPGRVEAYLSVINFISYELIAAVLWKIEKHKIDMSYGDLMECVSKIYEVELISKNSKIYRWNHISKDTEKILKPFNVLSLQP